jgi:hypothetical protein
LFFFRIRRLHLPGLLLLALLQRTPVLRLAAWGGPGLAAAPVAALLRSAALAFGSLGAIHALAGATTFLAQQGQTVVVKDGDPPKINLPVAATVGTPIAPVLFTVVGALTPPASFVVTNLPPGLVAATSTGRVANSAGLLDNVQTGLITGTPTTAGTFTASILTYEFPGGEATRGNETVGPNFIVFVVSGGAAAVAPSFTLQPIAENVAPGSTVTFTAAAIGSPTPSYQWRKDGGNLAGATFASYTIPSVSAADAGVYTVVATNSAGAKTSNPATLTVAPVTPTARLTNLSVRTVMAANQTLIVGVVVNDGSREVLVRAAGPALAAFGLSSAMVDPQLELFRGATGILSNDNWPAALAPTFSSVGAFAFTASSKDAAFLPTLDDAYSIQVRGTGPGVVLVEAYDTGGTAAARLVNVSARNRVGTGDGILIAGFNIGGAGSKRLLIRAVGPALAAFGVTGTLQDPKLEIYDSAGLKVAENDNWSGLETTFDAVGAFRLGTASRDSALLATLAAGSYTAQVRGADGGVGEALVEIYEVP